MTLPLSQDTLRSLYDFLATTPPFSKWNLPDGEDVIFRVLRRPDRFGQYQWTGNKHTIGISTACVGQTATLVQTMAHEMIHLHEEHNGACSPGAIHSAAFRKWAAQVCRIHGFDEKAF